MKCSVLLLVFLVDFSSVASEPLPGAGIAKPVYTGILTPDHQRFTDDIEERGLAASPPVHTHHHYHHRPSAPRPQHNHYYAPPTHHSYYDDETHIHVNKKDASRLALLGGVGVIKGILFSKILQSLGNGNFYLGKK